MWLILFSRSMEKEKSNTLLDRQNGSAVSPVELLRLLDSDDLIVVENIKSALRESLSAGDSECLQLLIEHYVTTSSPRSLEVILTVREPQERVLFEKLCDTLKSRSCETFALLFNIIQKQPSWLYKLTQHSLFGSLLKMGKTSKQSIPQLTSLLVFLCCLLPLVPQVSLTVLQELFGIFLRSAECLKNKCATLTEVTSVSADLAFLHLQVALYAYFLRLYGMFPCNFVPFLRKEFSGDVAASNRQLFQEIIRPMLVHVKIHPLLLTAPKEMELSKERWARKEPHDILAECAEVSFDPFEAALYGLSSAQSDSIPFEVSIASEQRRQSSTRSGGIASHFFHPSSERQPTKTPRLNAPTSSLPEASYDDSSYDRPVSFHIEPPKSAGPVPDPSTLPMWSPSFIVGLSTPTHLTPTASQVELAGSGSVGGAGLRSREGSRSSSALGQPMSELYTHYSYPNVTPEKMRHLSDASVQLRGRQRSGAISQTIAKYFRRSDFQKGRSASQFQPLFSQNSSLAEGLSSADHDEPSAAHFQHPLMTVSSRITPTMFADSSRWQRRTPLSQSASTEAAAGSVVASILHRNVSSASQADEAEEAIEETSAENGAGSFHARSLSDADVTMVTAARRRSSHQADVSLSTLPVVYETLRSVRAGENEAQLDAEVKQLTELSSHLTEASDQQQRPVAPEPASPGKVEPSRPLAINTAQLTDSKYAIAGGDSVGDFVGVSLPSSNVLRKISNTTASFCSNAENPFDVYRKISRQSSVICDHSYSQRLFELNNSLSLPEGEEVTTNPAAASATMPDGQTALSSEAAKGGGDLPVPENANAFWYFENGEQFYGPDAPSEANRAALSGGALANQLSSGSAHSQVTPRFEMSENAGVPSKGNSQGNLVDDDDVETDSVPRLTTSASVAEFMCRINRMRFHSQCVVGDTSSSHGEESSDEEAQQQDDARSAAFNGDATLRLPLICRRGRSNDRKPSRFRQQKRFVPKESAIADRSGAGLQPVVDGGSIVPNADELPTLQHLCDNFRTPQSQLTKRSGSCPPILSRKAMTASALPSIGLPNRKISAPLKQKVSVASNRSSGRNANSARHSTSGSTIGIASCGSTGLGLPRVLLPPSTVTVAHTSGTGIVRSAADCNANTTASVLDVPFAHCSASVCSSPRSSVAPSPLPGPPTAADSVFSSPLKPMTSSASAGRFDISPAAQLQHQLLQNAAARLSSNTFSSETDAGIGADFLSASQQQLHQSHPCNRRLDMLTSGDFDTQMPYLRFLDYALPKNKFCKNGNSASPFKILDEYVDQIKQHYVKSSNNRSVDLSLVTSPVSSDTKEKSFSGSMAGHHAVATGSQKMAEELASLKSELMLMHQQVLYERFKRQLLIQRNRRMFGRMKQMISLEQQTNAQRDQLRQQEMEIQHFIAAVSELRRNNVRQRDEFSLKEFSLAEQLKMKHEEVEKLRPQLELLAKEIGEGREQNKQLTRDLGAAKQRVFNLEEEMKLANEKIALTLETERRCELLQKRLFMNSELALMTKTTALEELKRRKHHDSASEERIRILTEASRRELAEAKRSLKRELGKADAAERKIQELEDTLHRRQIQIGQLKRQMDSNRDTHQEQLAALQAKYDSMVRVCHRQESHILDLYQQLELANAKLQQQIAHGRQSALRIATSAEISIPARAETKEIRSFDANNPSKTGGGGSFGTTSSSGGTKDWFLPHLFRDPNASFSSSMMTSPTGGQGPSQPFAAAAKGASAFTRHDSVQGGSSCNGGVRQNSMENSVAEAIITDQPSSSSVIIHRPIPRRQRRQDDDIDEGYNF